MWSKIKIGILAVLVVIALIVVFQNWSEIEVKLLFVTVAMPQAVFFLGTLGLGFVIGLTTSAIWKMQSLRSKSKKKAQNPKSELEKS